MSDAAKPEVQRIYYFDYLRVLALVGVVTLHTASPLAAEAHQHHAGLGTFWLTDLANVGGRFGVSTFFMISGALMLAPEHSFRLVKSLKRIGIPLVVWIWIYFGFAWLTRQWHWIPFQAPANFHLTTLIRAMLSGDVAFHLWFLYALFGIYLVLPLVRPFTAVAEPTRRRLLEYGLGLWLAFQVGLPLMTNVWKAVDPQGQPLVISALAIPSVPAGFLGTVILGFYLHRYAPAGRLTATIAVVVGAATLISGAGLIYALMQHNRPDEWVLDNLGPWAIGLAACALLLGKSLLNRPGPGFPLVSQLSNVSFRAYLVHVMVLHSLTFATPLKGWYLAHPTISIPVVVVAVTAISFAFALIVEQIKPIARYV